MELQIFKNEQFGQVQLLEINNEPWFVGKEIAEILGYKNSRDALSKHVDTEDKLTSQIATAGQMRNQTIINESGLYSLILSSKLQQAKEFKRWVTSEVLPSIRKHGAYLTDKVAYDITHDKDALSDLLLMAGNQLKEKDLVIQSLTYELKETKPKAEYYDLMLANKGLIKTSEIAKNYGRSAQAFNKLLHKLKVIYKQGETWLPYAKYQTHNYVQLEPFAYKNSRGIDDVKMRTKWTMKGHIFLYELLKKNGILPLIEQ